MSDDQEDVDWPDWFDPENASKAEKARIKHDYIDDDEKESDEGLPTAGYELVKKLENEETAEFYYGYDPRTSLSRDIYRYVNSLVRRSDVSDWIGKEHDELLLILHDCSNCSNNIDKHLENSSATCKEHKEIAARARALNHLLDEVQQD